VAGDPELVWPFPAETTINQNSTTSFFVILPLKKRASAVRDSLYNIGFEVGGVILESVCVLKSGWNRSNLISAGPDPKFLKFSADSKRVIENQWLLENRGFSPTTALFLSCRRRARKCIPLPRSPFERSRFAADAFACQVAAVCVKE
jgi:hypothetical protein